MIQSKLESLIETLLNNLSGIVISILVWEYIVAPLYGMPTSASTNVGITMIFTAASLIRSYAWRRFFASGIHRVVVKAIQMMLNKTNEDAR